MEREDIAEELGRLGRPAKWNSNVVVTLEHCFEDMQKYRMPGISSGLLMLLEQEDERKGGGEGEEEKKGLRIESVVLGANSYLVIRDGRKFYRAALAMTTGVQPNVLFSLDSWNSVLHDMVTKSLDVKEGDLIVVGSEGVYDNLYDNQIVDVFTLHKEMYEHDRGRNKQPTQQEGEQRERSKDELMNDRRLYLKSLAEAIAEEAWLASRGEYNKEKPTPLEARLAAESKDTLVAIGGKRDDVAVIVAEVVRLDE